MSALVKQLRLLQAWYLPAGPEPEEAMPSKYRAFKEAADRIVELERDLAAAQEARDMHFARVRSLTLDLSDAVGRYQRAEALAESLKADAERLAYLRSIAYRSYVGERRGDYWFLTALCADGGGADFIAAIDAERGKE